MIELTVVKYDHSKEQISADYNNFIKKTIKDHHFYAIEISPAKENIEELEKKVLNDILKNKIKKIFFRHPFNLMYEEAVKQKTYLFFLERSYFPDELNFFPKEEKLNDSVKEVLSGKKTFEELKADIKSVVYLRNENIKTRDKKMAEELENIENKMTCFFTDEFQIKLPENKKYLKFVGAYHNFEKLAYEKLKNDKNFFFYILIPDIGKEHQENLHIDIITAQAFKKEELNIFNYYSRISDSFFNGLKINLGNQKLKEVFRKYFNNELTQLQEIKGGKVPFEDFDKIMQNIDINKFSEINEIMEKELEKAIKFRKSFGFL